MNYEVKFVEIKNCRYIYLINGVEIDLKENLNENALLQRLDYIYFSLKSKIDFRESGINIPLRDFILLGFMFCKKELSQYFICYIEKLILSCTKNRLTEILTLKYIFNANMTEVQYSIHSSTDKSIQKYNDNIKNFITNQIVEAKKVSIRKLLLNRDTDTLFKVIRLITLNSFLQICGSDFLQESIEYFHFIIKQKILPANAQLSLNGIIASATGFSHKQTKDTKNMFKSKEKEILYKEIEILINKSKPEFYLLKEEKSYMKNIEDALNNYKKLNEGELKKLRQSRVLKICMELFETKFVDYLEYFAIRLKRENRIISRTNMIMSIFENIEEQQANHIYTYYKMNNSNTMLEDFIINHYKNQVNSQHQPNFIYHKNKWILYWKIKEKVARTTINFSELNNSFLTNEIKQYYKFLIDKEYRYKSEGDSKPSIFIKSNLIIKSIKYMQEYLHINSAKDIKLIHVYKLVKYLKNEYKSNSNKKIKVSSIVNCVGTLKGFIDWLIENNISGLPKPEVNPFQYVTFKGVYNKNTDIIPECVIDKMLFYLNELREDIQRMLLIMLNCGLRFKEVAYLEEDCISESTDECKVLKYIPYKVLEARIRNGLDNYHRIVIDDELYKEIESQIEYTRYIRENYNAKEIFLTIGINNNLCMIDSTMFCRTVQKLINAHNIKDEQGQLWKISSKQYRKTLAVDMITKSNANEYEVANFLGHLSEETTKKFYAEVRKMKGAKINNDFFKKKFDLLMKEEQLENFNEEERKSLYVDFCLNIRDVEYGVCTKKINADTCKRRGDVFGCATCSKICTGKKYFKRWTGLYENQKSRVDLLIKNYISHNIKSEEYEGFREYSKEKYLLDSFKVVVDKLTEEYGDDS